jgi:hypothetical protein
MIFCRSLLRDIKLQPTRGPSRSTLEDDFIREGIDIHNIQFNSILLICK